MKGKSEKSKIEEKKTEPRRFYFADEDILKLAELQDACHLGGGFGSRQSSVGIYHLWRFVGERFPEARTGKWTLEIEGAYGAMLIERINEEQE